MNGGSPTSPIHFIRPQNRLSGFRADRLAAAGLPLEEIGELWTPREHHIPDHVNDGWEIYFQEVGSSRWVADRSSHQLGPGGFYVMPPGMRHRLEAFDSESAHFYFVVFRPDRALDPDGRTLLDRWKQRAYFGHDGYPLATPLRSLVREVCLDDPWRVSVILAHLAVLCVEVTRLLSLRRPRLQPSLNSHPGTARARELLEARPGHPWRLDELAALCGMSIQHLITCFNRELATTPMRFLLRVRVERAADALQFSDLPITRIAHDLGFSSSQHLSRAFAERHGCSPSAFRKESRRGGRKK